MRVGLVRNVGLSAVALLAFGLAGCDDNPLEFEDGVAVLITTNPSQMVVPAGLAQRLESRTVDQGSRPTWDDIDATVDATCGAGAITVIRPTDWEPTITPSGVFQVIAGNTLGSTCITLDGAGLTESVEVRVVGDSLDIQGTPAGQVLVYDAVQLSTTLRADDGTPVSPFDPLIDIVWFSDNREIGVPSSTGLVQTGPKGGGVILTATWTDTLTAGGSGATRTATTTIDVDIPVPVLTLTDVSNAFGGDLVTITGTGFIGTGPSELVRDAHRIFVDGFLGITDRVELQDTTKVFAIDDTDPLAPDTTFQITSIPTIVNATTATFLMPLGAAVDVSVTVGSVCCGQSNVLTVTRDDIPPPVLISTDIGNGNAGDLVTITATDIFLGNAIVPANLMFIDGAVVGAGLGTIVDATTATFLLPQRIAGTDVEIQIGDPIAGLSNTLMVTVDTQDEDPANDDPSTAGLLPPLPVSLTRRIGVGDVNDFYVWSPAAQVTVDLDLSWVGASGDLDLLFTNATASAFRPLAPLSCFFLATGAVPESGQCTFPADEYRVWVNDYEGALGITEYLLEMVAVP